MVTNDYIFFTGLDGLHEWVGHEKCHLCNFKSDFWNKPGTDYVFKQNVLKKFYS